MYRNPSTEEYVLFTNFTMTVDSAKTRLNKEFDLKLNDCDVKWNHIEKEISEIIIKEHIRNMQIPHWEPVDTETGMNWIKSTIYEGYYIKYRINTSSKIIDLISWEYGEEEPIFT